MSQRTRRALDAHGLSNPDHLSHQLTAEDADSADLIAVFEPNHINFVRRQHPTAAHKTAPLPWWARSLPSVPFEDRAAFANWLLPHALDEQPIDPADEVIDPAGGEQDVFDASAHEIAELIDTLAARLSADGA